MLAAFGADIKPKKTAPYLTFWLGRSRKMFDKI